MRAPLTPATRTALASGAVSLALLLLVVAHWDPLLRLDRTVATGLHRDALSDPGATHVVRVFTDWVWDPWTMRVLTAVVVVALLLGHRRFLAGWVVGVTLVGWGLEQGLKAALGRDRPRWAHPVDSAGFASFPSGHAMTATVACGLLLWVLWHLGARGVPWAFAVGVAAVSVVGVGLTRLWLGVHWMSDVLAGWSFGTCVVVLSIAAYGRLALSRYGEPARIGP